MTDNRQLGNGIEYQKSKPMNRKNSTSPAARIVYVVAIVINILMAILLAVSILWQEPDAIIAVIVMLTLINTMAFFLHRQIRMGEPATVQRGVRRVAGYGFFCAGMLSCKIFFDANDDLVSVILFAAGSTVLYIVADIFINRWRSAASSQGGI